jgi:hypothetical protein
MDMKILMFLSLSLPGVSGTTGGQHKQVSLYRMKLSGSSIKTVFAVTAFMLPT